MREQMWRGIGEVMCRHDDLTTMLLDREVPRVNHPALEPIFEFCIETNLPILVHHNADRVGSSDETFAYVSEVEEVRSPGSPRCGSRACMHARTHHA